MNRSASELAALSRLFSSSVFHELAKKGRSGLFGRLASLSKLIDYCKPNATVGDAFDAAYNSLKIAGCRNEYIYRSAISHKILMGKHSLNTASMLTEFRVGTSRADLVILNGTATVYEIKSERDSLVRLLNQIEDYYRVFGHVNVIAGETHVDEVCKRTPVSVGVLCLSNRHQISTIREAENRKDRICPLTVLDSLRAAEATEILKSLEIPIPKVPNTQRHAALSALFAPVGPSILHEKMVQTLRRTRSQAPLRSLVNSMPDSLKTAALSVSVRRSDHGNLIDAVETPLPTALSWS